MKIRYLWLGLTGLLLLFAFDSLVLGLMRPVVLPSLNTLTDKIGTAFISIVAAGIIMYFALRND